MAREDIKVVTELDDRTILQSAGEEVETSSGGIIVDPRATQVMVAGALSRLNVRDGANLLLPVTGVLERQLSEVDADEDDNWRQHLERKFEDLKTLFLTITAVRGAAQKIFKAVRLGDLAMMFAAKMIGKMSGQLKSHPFAIRMAKTGYGTAAEIARDNRATLSSAELREEALILLRDRSEDVAAVVRAATDGTFVTNVAAEAETILWTPRAARSAAN